MRESKLRQIHATVAVPHVEYVYAPYVSWLFIDEVKHKMDIQFCPQNDGRPLYGPQLQRWALMSDPIGLHRYHMVSRDSAKTHVGSKCCLLYVRMFTRRVILRIKRQYSVIFGVFENKSVDL